MYKQISIKNIKTFEDEQKLKIAPLTLIYGENSSGKTTLLKAFDIVHNIFQQRSVTAGGKTAGINLERGSFEDVKNISARKIHFFSSKINKKPIQIELTLNLPYRNIDSDHPLFSNKITEKYEYFEETIHPRSDRWPMEKRGGGKTIARRTFGRSTYYTDRMPDGSIRKMVITDTGEGEGGGKKYKISLLNVSKLFKSKNKIKMVPAKFLIEIKYFPGLKLSKINKLEIKTIDNKPIIGFSRVARQYNLPTNDRVYGHAKKFNKQKLLSSIKENPDYFTSSAGYADYKINLTKENNLWLRSYKKYEKIFSNDADVKTRLNKIKLLFECLNRYRWLSVTNRIKQEARTSRVYLRETGEDINWRDFSSLISQYVLSNNNTSYSEMVSTLSSLFNYDYNRDKKETKILRVSPKSLNSENIDALLYEQMGAELVDGEIVFSGMEPEFCTSDIINKHSNAKNYQNEIILLSLLLQNADHTNLLIIENFLNKKVSFKKFCVEIKRSYKEFAVRFKRISGITGMGTTAEIKHSLVNDYGQKQCTNFDILLAFSDYIKGDIKKAFNYFSKSGHQRAIGTLKRITPHYLLNKCIREIKKTVGGFVPCHPNKSETSYDVPMEEEFDWEEIARTIGKPGTINRKIKIISSLKQLGIHQYKEIIVDANDPYGKEKVRKLYKKHKIIDQAILDYEGSKPSFTSGGKYIPDYLIETKKGKKIAVEIIYKKNKKEKLENFNSDPSSITPEGIGFDSVICWNKKLREDFNKILKPLFNLKIKVVAPKWIKNLPPETYDELRKGWDRGSYRNLWNLRKKWPKKQKFILLQDLSFKKPFYIHGKEVGKGPSNFLPFLAQLLSKKPNLTYLIQELENNWHPKNQGKITKAIVNILKESDYKHFILETHSELFILQVKQLVEMGILKPEDVSINYVSRSNDGKSEVVNIPLTSEGAFTKDWPGGFFNERTKILTE